MEQRGADISACGRYRYRLWRIWDHTLPVVCWIMLNPSTADADVDDATIRKCMVFARAWGYGGIRVVNLFPYRATDPKELKAVGAFTAVGDGNINWILESARSSQLVIAAWGANVDKLSSETDHSVRWQMEKYHLPLHALKLTKSGQPYHPLYLKGDTKPFLWDANAVAAN